MLDFVKEIVHVPVRNLCLLQQLAYCRLQVQSQETLLGYYVAGSNESYDVVYQTTVFWTTHEYYRHSCWTPLRLDSGWGFTWHFYYVGLVSKMINRPRYITPTDTTLPTVWINSNNLPASLRSDTLFRFINSPLNKCNTSGLLRIVAVRKDSSVLSVSYPLAVIFYNRTWTQTTNYSTTNTPLLQST
jgi:hypothetical protein